MFWARRMALEIAVHRYDGELAHGDATAIPDDLALDGIDEMLKVFLAGDCVDRTTPDRAPGRRAGRGRGRRPPMGLLTCSAKSVTITDGDTAPAAATVLGHPEPMSSCGCGVGAATTQ